MKDPAFLFYPQDFLVGAMTMTFEDKGKYITILCLMHQQGRLDEKTISFLVGSISDILRLKFLVDENGFWYNKRLEEEIEKRNRFIESRMNNGKLGGRPKKQETYKKPKGKPNQNLIEDVNENEIINPSSVEVESYFKEKGYNKTGAEKFFNYYTETGWKDKDGKPVKNWKLKAVSVWFREEYKIKADKMVY